MTQYYFDEKTRHLNINIKLNEFAGKMLKETSVVTRFSYSYLQVCGLVRKKCSK